MIKENALLWRSQSILHLFAVASDFVAVEFATLNKYGVRFFLSNRSISAYFSMPAVLNGNGSHWKRKKPHLKLQET